jgi:hypothetical protein
MHPIVCRMHPLRRRMHPSTSVCAPQSTVCAPYASVCAPPTCVCALLPAYAPLSQPYTPGATPTIQRGSDVAATVDKVSLDLPCPRSTTYPVLRTPVWDRLFHIYCDASAVAVGSVLCQSTDDGGRDYPIAFSIKWCFLSITWKSDIW